MDEHLVDIVNGIRKGDQKSFKKLFDMYYTEMVKSAYIMLKEKDLAKEAAQEAFVAVWNNRSKLDESKSIRAYLKTATTSRALNILKSIKHHRGVGEEGLGFKRDKSNDPHKAVEQVEMGKQITAAVNSLPEKCRLVFVMAKYDGYSHKEIAEKMNISTKTVENQIGKALKILREALKDLRIVSIIMIGAWGI